MDTVKLGLAPFKRDSAEHQQKCVEYARDLISTLDQGRAMFDAHPIENIEDIRFMCCPSAFDKDPGLSDPALFLEVHAGAVSTTTGKGFEDYAHFNFMEVLRWALGRSGTCLTNRNVDLYFAEQTSWPGGLELERAKQEYIPCLVVYNFTEKDAVLPEDVKKDLSIAVECYEDDTVRKVTTTFLFNVQEVQHWSAFQRIIADVYPKWLFNARAVSKVTKVSYTFKEYFPYEEFFGILGSDIVALCLEHEEHPEYNGCWNESDTFVKQGYHMHGTSDVGSTGGASSASKPGVSVSKMTF